MKRGLLWAAYAVYLVAVAYLVWDPDPTVPSSTVWRISHWFDQVNVPVSPPTVEFGLNVLLFVPMSLLGSFLFPRLRVAEWVMVGFLASLTVELVQKLFLTGRTADPKDVVSNTLGVLIGALLATAVSRSRLARLSKRPKAMR
jgi:glycopeptide antibiotics resistance protein